MRRIIFPLFLILIFSIACDTINSKGSSNTAKNFELPSISDDSNYQLKQFKGKPVIINFWASWCAPCRQEMPFLEAVWNENKEKGLILLGINVMDDKEEAVDTLKEFGISYLNLYDTDGDVRNSYNLLALPVTYFIEKDGSVSKINYGPFLGKEGEELFQRQLKQIMK